MNIIEQSANHYQKKPERFFSQFRNQALALGIYLLVWLVVSLLLHAEIPSPYSVFVDSHNYFSISYLREHVFVTIGRTLIGFSGAFVLGIIAGLLSVILHIDRYVNTVMIFFHIVPGLILGIVLLSIFGLGSPVPILMILFLVTPLVSIQTANAVIKRDRLIEEMIRVSGGRLIHLLFDSYLPALATSIKSNYTIGFGLALKVVILGEFIGSSSGIGYRLNVAYIFMNMQEVFFHFSLILMIMLVFQILFSALYSQFFTRLLYNE